MTTLSLKIATPERVVFEDKEITSVTLQTSEGEITILPGHVPLVTKIKPGEMTVRWSEKADHLAVMGGYLKLDATGNIIVLSDYAIRAEEVEIAKVEEAKKKAEIAMKEKVSQKDFILAQSELAKTLLELKVALKRKSARIVS